MIIDIKNLESDEKRDLLAQAIVPRPIAWVVSKNDTNSFTLAPFSYFNIVSDEPPMVMLSIGRNKDGSKKETWQNLEREKNFVIHIPSQSDIDYLIKSFGNYEFNEINVYDFDLRVTNLFEDPSAPGLSTTRLAFLCSLNSKHEIHGSHQEVLFAEIQSVYIDNNAYEFKNDQRHIDIHAIEPVAKLGRNEFTVISEII